MKRNKARMSVHRLDWPRSIRTLITGVALPLTMLVVVALAGGVGGHSRAFSQIQRQRLFLIGDSTMADKPLAENPERGWGQMLPRFLDQSIEVRNLAVDGRSTKSFRDEGRWTALLTELRKDDWVFVQFGNNDQKVADPARYASPADFRANLSRYVEDVRAKGAHVLLLTPVTRRKFDDAGKLLDTHGEYPEAVRAVARALNVPMLDHNASSSALVERAGAHGSKQLYLWIPALHFQTLPDGKQDDTHFSEYGAAVMAALVADGIRKLNLDLAAHLKPSDFPEKFEYELPAVYQPHFAQRYFDIGKFGAVSGGIVSCTSAINGAINAAHEAGGGVVLIPRGLWLTGPIVLKSNVELRLDAGALVSFSRKREEFPLVLTSFEGVAAFRSQAPISAFKAENVAITGAGIFDGGGDAWKAVVKGKVTETEWRALLMTGGVVSADGARWYPSESALRGSINGDVGKVAGGKQSKDFEAVKDFLRPNMVQIIESKGILISGVTFQNSPAWTLHFLLSEQITLRNVRVKNPWYGQNNDGIDLESSRNVLLDGCVFDTGDDGITLKSGRDEEGRRRGIPTENIVVRNCTVYRAHGGFVIGSEMSGGVRNVFISNSTFIGSDIGLRFKTKRGRGGIVEQVYVSNISMKDIPGAAISFDMYYEAVDPIPLVGDNRVLPEARALPVDEATPQFRDFFLHQIVVQGASRAVFIRGLPEMHVKNVTMEDLTVQSGTGLYCEEADGLALKNLTLYTANTNPMVTVRNATDFTLDHLVFKPDADLLLDISGARNTGIRILNTDLSGVRKQVQLGAGVANSVLTMR